MIPKNIENPIEWSSVILLIRDILHFRLFEINQTPVSIASILMFVLVMFIFFIISRITNRVILKQLFVRLKLDESKSYTVIHITHYLIMIIGAIVSFQFIGIDLSGLAVIFGLLSVGIGFGLQNVTSNFIAGIILLFERPISIGDRVIVGDIEGDVEEISIRSTKIRTLNNVYIIVPNSHFVSGSVINWSHADNKTRIEVPVGVSYHSDLDTVITALLEVATENGVVLKNPEPDVLLREFGDSSWNMVLRVWIPDPKQHHIIRSDLNKAIVRKFRKHNVEIPFPQRDVHIFNRNAD